ncbi:GldG family protein, partial [Candidatus Sumerlaeota bacterium]|nr:GldG family protein [Candidatus Sumerlaeota bacterium]
MSRIRHGSNFVVVAVSLFLILLVINVFSYRHFVRWDLTANRDYTISKATRDLLTSLDNLITVKVYLSKKMPAALLTFEEQLREVLAEYERYAKGKLRIEFVIPPDDETGQRELLIRGIQPQVVPQMQRDTLTQTVVYDAITMEYQNQREIIPHLYDRLGRGLRGDFEYLFTSRIAKIGSGPRRAVGWLTNAPGLDIASKYRSVRKAISEEWECRDIRLDPPAKISPEISVLIVISPREFTDVQLFEIDQYLMRGGRILVLLEGYSPQSRRGSDGRQLVESIAAQPTNLTRLLDRCGLKVNQEVVLDPSQCAFAPTAAGMRMRYPFWVSITDSGLNKNNPAVMRLQRIILPWTQTFDATSSKPAGVEMIPLAWTSPN